MEAAQALFVRFPGSVRMEVGSTLSVHYPKPGKPVVKAANILDDLRRRDFTANAMALSLNEGSYGLLMDPLNGVADIENRELRLVSNYGFIEDPVRMIRAARFAARLGWQMEEKTKARYDTGKDEGYISAMSAFQRGYEAEEIVARGRPAAGDARAGARGLDEASRRRRGLRRRRMRRSWRSCARRRCSCRCAESRRTPRRRNFRC